jgi:hypothetical protein
MSGSHRAGEIKRVVCVCEREGRREGRTAEQQPVSGHDWYVLNDLKVSRPSSASGLMFLSR